MTIACPWPPVPAARMAEELEALQAALLARRVRTVHRLAGHCARLSRRADEESAADGLPQRRPE